MLNKFSIELFLIQLLSIIFASLFVYFIIKFFKKNKTNKELRNIYNDREIDS